MSKHTPLRLPRRFYDDHEDRALPTPRAIRNTKRHVWVMPSDGALRDLLEDARYYADPLGPDDCPDITRAARATLAVIARAEGEK